MSNSDTETPGHIETKTPSETETPSGEAAAVDSQLVEMFGEAEPEALPATQEDQTTSEPKEDPPPTETPTIDPLEELKKQNEDLRAKLEELAGQAYQPQAEQPATPPPAEEPLLTDDEFDAAMNSRGDFEKALKKVEVRTQERLTQALPKVLSNLINTQVEQRMTIESFFMENKDLRPTRKYMQHVANELVTADPTLAQDLPKLLVRSAEETRKQLKLLQASNGTTGEERDSSRKPPLALPTNSARSAKAPPMGDVERQLMEMFGKQEQRR